jgi:hypothetical protein
MDFNSTTRHPIGLGGISACAPFRLRVGAVAAISASWAMPSSTRRRAVRSSRSR